MTFADAKPKQNWFLTWEEDTASEGKSFLLQVKLNNVTTSDFLGAAVNSYVTLSRCQDHPDGDWEWIGQTEVIRDEPNPEYPEGFRVFYDQKTNINSDLLKLTCYNKKNNALGPLAYEETIGSASLSVRELVRAFGTRVQLELTNSKTGKIVGLAWFLGEALPSRSPKGGGNIFEFKISAMEPRRSEVKHQLVRVFLIISRQREDKTWIALYRSSVVRRQSRILKRARKIQLSFPPFELRQSELVLGTTPRRKVKFELFQKGKSGDPHTSLGEVITSVDELLHEFGEDTSIDLCLNGQTIGEFADMSRKEMGSKVCFEIDVNYFDIEEDARMVQEKRKKQLLNLDSP